MEVYVVVTCVILDCQNISYIDVIRYPKHQLKMHNGVEFIGFDVRAMNFTCLPQTCIVQDLKTIFALLRSESNGGISQQCHPG